MSRFYPISIVAFLALVAVAAVLSTSGPLAYLHVPSLIIVLGLPAAVMLATHSPKEIGASFRAAYRGSGAAELKAAVLFFTALGRTFLWAGFLATLIGLVAMLAVLGDATQIGSGAALAIITVLYAVMLHLLVALPFRHAAEKRLAALE